MKSKKFDEVLLASLLSTKTGPKMTVNKSINRLSVDLSVSPQTIRRGLAGNISERTSKKLISAFADLSAQNKARTSQAFEELNSKGRAGRVKALKGSFVNPLKWNKKLAKRREMFDKKRVTAERKGNAFVLKNLSLLGGLQ